MKPEFWNERFSQSELVYGTEPNMFFAEQLSKLPVGKLLLPAEGQGRNAIFAAKLGWEVTAFDYSSVAKEKALALAAGQGVSIDYLLMDYESLDLPSGAFDAVGLIFAHMAPTLRPSIHQKIAQSLKENGTLILEAFHKKQLPLKTGGPKNEGMLLNEAELESDFGSWLSISKLVSERINLNEGVYHQGEAEVIRMVGSRLER